jgi:hypothetical protein
MKAIDDHLVPRDSSSKQKYHSTEKKLYSNYKKLLPETQAPLNKSYFYELINDMKLTKVNQIQQCSYCFDLQNPSTLSATRLAQCLIHQYIKVQQSQSYWLDKNELSNGQFGKRIFGQVQTGVLLVVDYGVMKPSSSRHEDFVCLNIILSH